MDISRGSQTVHVNHDPDVSVPSSAKSSKRKSINSWVKISELVLLFTVMILVIAILIGIYQGPPSESKYVQNSKFQAVFLNGGVANGQVLYSTYFGHIVALNSNFLVLQDVYYINGSTTATSAASVQLTKLGCQQLHAPYDQMVINRDQVAFWENLQASGQVVKAIDNYQKENPNGPNCTQSSGSTTSAPTSTNSPAATTNTTANTTTNSTANTTKP